MYSFPKKIILRKYWCLVWRNFWNNITFRILIYFWPPLIRRKIVEKYFSFRKCFLVSICLHGCALEIWNKFAATWKMMSRSIRFIFFLLELVFTHTFFHVWKCVQSMRATNIMSFNLWFCSLPLCSRAIIELRVFFHCLFQTWIKLKSFHFIVASAFLLFLFRCLFILSFCFTFSIEIISFCYYAENSLSILNIAFGMCRIFSSFVSHFLFYRVFNKACIN